MGLFSGGRGGDAGLGVAPVQPLPQPVRVIGAIGDQDPRPWQGGRKFAQSLGVMDLSGRQMQRHRSAVMVAGGMQLAGQSAAGAADGTLRTPFLSRLAAVRCAFGRGASTCR